MWFYQKMFLFSISKKGNLKGNDIGINLTTSILIDLIKSGLIELLGERWNIICIKKSPPQTQYPEMTIIHRIMLDWLKQLESLLPLSRVLKIFSSRLDPHQNLFLRILSEFTRNDLIKVDNSRRIFGPLYNITPKGLKNDKDPAKRELIEDISLILSYRQYLNYYQKKNRSDELYKGIFHDAPLSGDLPVNMLYNILFLAILFQGRLSKRVYRKDITYSQRKTLKRIIKKFYPAKMLRRSMSRAWDLKYKS